MGSIEINGVEHVQIDSIELDGSEDITERLTRAKETLQAKQAQRQQVEQDRELKAYIEKYYGKELKDVAAFTKLCKTMNLTADDDKEILTLYKKLPKAAKKSTLSRFFKL